MNPAEFLPILKYPDPRLLRVARPVAAVHERVIVIDVSEARDQPLVLINPELLWASPETSKGDEGCLSVPGVYDGVERALAVRVRALDAHGHSRVIEAEGLLAVCIQHEMDHLQGKVFVEYLSLLKRTRIKAKLLKAEREGEAERPSARTGRRAVPL